MSSECTLKDLREDHMIHQTECSLEGWGLTNMEPPTEQEAHAEFDRVIAAELAAAWAEGHDAGWDERDDFVNHGAIPSGKHQSEAVNPYLADQIEER